METSICKLKFRRGLEKDRHGIIPDSGEPIYCYDSKRLCIGDGQTAGGNPITKVFTTQQELSSTGEPGDICVVDDSLFVLNGEKQIITIAGAGSIAIAAPISKSSDNVIGLNYDANYFSIGNEKLTVSDALNSSLQTISNHTSSIASLSSDIVNKIYSPSIGIGGIYIGNFITYQSNPASYQITDYITYNGDRFNFNVISEASGVYPTLLKGELTLTDGEKNVISNRYGAQLLYDTNVFETKTQQVTGIYDDNSVEFNRDTSTYTVTAAVTSADVLTLNMSYILNNVRKAMYKVGDYYITESVEFDTVDKVEAEFGGTWEIVEGQLLTGNTNTTYIYRKTHN